MGEKKVAIFGSRSRSAQHLIQELELKDFDVKSFSSVLEHDSVYKYDIYDLSEFEFDFDVAIYFSWATCRNEKNQSLAAAAASNFAELARAQNVDVVFISSLASLPSGPKSHYGKYKFKAEQSMRLFGHTIFRPATIVSKSRMNFSSSVSELSKFRFSARLFSYLSEKFVVPLLEIETFSEEIIKEIRNTSHEEINLIQQIVTLESLIGVPSPMFRIPLPWTFIYRVSRRSAALDRLLTLISVSQWIIENRVQSQSMIQE